MQGELPIRAVKSHEQNPTLLQERPVLVDDSAARIGKILLDPKAFAKHFLKTDLWDIQAQIAYSIDKNPRTAVKACHASGKTFVAACILLWFLARHQEAIVVTTAPTWQQVEKLLWGEVHAALARSIYPYPKPTMTEIRLGPKRYAYGLSTSVTNQDEGVKFQGIHAENELIILDEAPGVDPKIWTAIEGNRAGGNVRILAIGNPTISSGPFHTAFHEGRETWANFTISAFDCPNLKGLTLESLLEMGKKHPEMLDDNALPYLTTRRWVYERYFEWGPGHPLWESRVLGNFPAQSEDALLSLTWLEEAGRRDLKGKGEDGIKVGIDVAGPGEAETVFCARRGPEILELTAWPREDPRGEIVAKLNKYRDHLVAVNIDAIGIGWGIYLHLSDLKFPVIPINVAETARDSEKFANQKAEYYWGLRLRAQSGDISGLKDEKSIGQLAGIRYKHNSRGQVEIESKKDAAKRGVKSPDRAEAIMLAFAENQLVFGALDYFKRVQQDMEKIATSTLIKPVLHEGTCCPECAARCVIPYGNGFRCNQCGKQFGEKERKPIGLSRKDLLIKTRAR